MNKAKPKVSPEVIAYVKTGVRIFSGLMGGLLAGACLLIIACRRGEVWAGVIAMCASVILGTALGTILTLIPAVVLWLYLRRRPEPPTQVAPVPRWWVVLLWLLLLAGIYIGLQSVAVVVYAIPIIMERPDVAACFVDVLMADRATYVIMISSAWIALLALLTICPPQSREGWRRQLGLNPAPWLSSLAWLLGAGVLMAAASWGSDQIMDEKSREAMRHMTLGFAVPVPFLLALVLVGPLVEELIFRGYVFTAWAGRMGFWGAALLSSLIFAVIHFQYGPVAFAYVFILGMILCGLRRKTGSLYPAIIFHMLNNLASVLLWHFYGAH